MYPARTSQRWLGTTASAGSSRSVRTNSSDMRVITGTHCTVRLAPGPALMLPVQPLSAARSTDPRTRCTPTRSETLAWTEPGSVTRPHQGGHHVHGQSDPTDQGPAHRIPPGAALVVGGGAAHR